MCRVLIVERDVLVARDIQSRLGRLGYQVAGTASNDREAISMALASMPDLILIDLDLGGDMAGIEVGIKLSKSESMPMIFCATKTDAAFIEGVASLSSADYSFGYLQKPFGNHELQLSIKLALSRHGMQQALATRMRYFDVTLDSIEEGIVLVDTHGKVLLSNRAAEKLLGVARHTASGLHLDELVRNSSFKQKPIELSVNVEHASLRVMSLRDLSAQVAYAEARQQEAFSKALFDDLTGLPNRSLFIERLQQLVHPQQSRSSPCTILLVGIDELSVVSDSLGRELSNRVIKALGRRITAVLAETQPSATVARYDEDIFAILLDSLDTPDPVATSALLCQRILMALHRPLDLNVEPSEDPSADQVAEQSRNQSGNKSADPLNMKVSVGMAVQQDAPMSAQEMLQDASLRLKQAQSGSRSQEDEMPVNSSRHHKLQQTMLAGGFQLHYQPVMSLGTGALVGLEAFLWETAEDTVVGTIVGDAAEGSLWNPAEGSLWDRAAGTILGDAAAGAMLPSAEVMPLAEATGLSLPLGKLVIQEVCTHLKQWQDLEFPAIHVAINLNVSQFETDIATLLLTSLSQAGIEPARLELNITEALAVNIQRGYPAQEVSRKLRMLEELHASGVNLSLDNFGMGTASLTHIMRLPLTSVKLAPPLSAALVQRKAMAETVLAINALAHSLKLKVFAKGVATAEQAAALQDCGCDYAQGSFYANAIHVADMPTYLKNYYADME